MNYFIALFNLTVLLGAVGLGGIPFLLDGRTPLETHEMVVLGAIAVFAYLNLYTLSRAARSPDKSLLKSMRDQARESLEKMAE